MLRVGLHGTGCCGRDKDTESRFPASEEIPIRCEMRCSGVIRGLTMAAGEKGSRTGW